MAVQIHPLSKDPTAAWREISKSQRIIEVTMKPPKVSVRPNNLRVVCMSDTHSLTSHIKFDIPDGDLFIHAGDFTRFGQKKEVVEFNNWIGRLPHKHKIVIAGNHEISFDKTENCKHFFSTENTGTTQNVREMLTKCTYIEDALVEICGIRIYGSPWTPEFCSWAFNLTRGQSCLEKWNLIPEGVDILVTHGPPVGHGDLCRSGVRAGCVELLTTVQKRVKPKYHVFGHIHEGYGVTSDGQTIFVNASTCNIKYVPQNAPIVFDITLPPGRRKE